jgi:predicted RNase H-like nuclease
MVTRLKLTVWGMYFVGVDLAWGERSPTGVAAVDDAGVLRHVDVATSDEDVLAQLAPYVGGDCVVAIDAPLVVTNPSGNRPCEAALNRDFRRFDAGAHPANTGLAWFADGGRGARLCSALDLDLDPRSTSARRAMEVYPHAASVVLFGLPKTLKYKQKQGREVPQIRSELLRLIGFVEDLITATPSLELTACPQWNALRAAVRAATRKSELRRAEDPIDAVLCAYIARYAATRPQDVTVYGETATGCIVTPTLRP